MGTQELGGSSRPIRYGGIVEKMKLLPHLLGDPAQDRHSRNTCSIVSCMSL